MQGTTELAIENLPIGFAIVAQLNLGFLAALFASQLWIHHIAPNPHPLTVAASFSSADRADMRYAQAGTGPWSVAAAMTNE